MVYPAMKTLILYMSHTGSTTKVACTIAQHFMNLGTVSVHDLKHDDEPHPEKYDLVMIGGSIRAGQIQSKIKKYCKAHLLDLQKVRLGLFLCFMDNQQKDVEFERAYPKELREHATSLGFFGGEFLLEELNFAERFILRSVAGVKSNVYELDDDAINSFIQQMDPSHEPAELL